MLTVDSTGNAWWPSAIGATVSPGALVKMALQKPMVRRPRSVRRILGHIFPDAVDPGVHFVDEVEQYRLDGLGWFGGAEFPCTVVADDHMLEQLGLGFRKIRHLFQFLIQHGQTDVCEGAPVDPGPGQEQVHHLLGRPQCRDDQICS